VDPARIECVGGIVTDHRGQLLLVRRRNEPAKGRWSVPGGRKDPGESDAAATAREVCEETGLHVVVGRLAGMVERDAPDGSVYLIRDYWCTPLEGIDPADVHAGDDAENAAWFTAAEVRELDCSPGLVAELERWGVLPPSDPEVRTSSSSGG